MNRQWNQIKIKLKCAVLALALCSVLVCALVAVRSEGYAVWQPTTLAASWVQIAEGETYSLAAATEFIPVATQDALVLETTLPEITQDKLLFFYTKDVEVSVYLDDALVYTFAMQEGLSFLQTPGNYWNSVDLSAANSGAVLRLVLTSQFENRYMTTMETLYLINPVETLSVVLYKDGFRILMSAVVFFMAMIAYVNTVLWERKALKQYFFALGNLYFSVALWLFAMYGMLDYFFQRPIGSYLLSMLMANAIPIAMYEFVKVCYGQKSKALTALGYVVWLSFAGAVLLQFLCGVSLLDLLPLTYLVFVVGSVSCAWLIIRYFVRCKNWRALNFSFASLLIVFAGAIAEVVVLCVLPKRTDLIGMAAICGLFIYLIANQIYITRQESKIDIEKIALEKNYQKLQSTTLMQEIKAHFFYNTLNAISALCKEDAAKADRAVLLFAKYMRTYMHLINQQENIPLSQELALVQCTLDIEAIRFPERFSYQLLQEDVSAMVPPLCIQPLVENAIGHGLRNVAHHGEIIVRTWRQKDLLCVTITDNGIGFDVSQLEHSNSIGLKKLENRIAIMANGTVEILSEKGKGTQITLSFPITQ